jgi:6-pyruvoyltetrahydropterin/6-carboxytetrahydropterin synthase
MVMPRWPFQVTATRSFAAGHALRMYNGTMEDMHTHDWRVKVTVGAAKLDVIGVVMDFHVLERSMDAVLAIMTDRNLNDLPPFTDVNPSAEQVACHIAKSVKLPKSVTLQSVEVWETEDNSAIYSPDGSG